MAERNSAGQTDLGFEMRAAVTYLHLRDAILTRVRSGEWPLGGPLPNEMALADEYGCSRVTVNRALQGLADDGLLIRKRKGGTRVASTPVRRATFSVPIVREQVETSGALYSHRVTARRSGPLPQGLQQRLGASASALFLETFHYADQEVYCVERRWINLDVVRDAARADFSGISPNEWLVRTMPFSRGDLTLRAASPPAAVARALSLGPKVCCFVMDRTTWQGEQYITTMSMYHHAGFEMSSAF